jgi:hypothetical protein
MTDDHKAALAVGRAESKVVRDYLEALRTNKPKRGRRRTSDSIAARLAALDEEMATADPLTELKLVQERMNLEEELENMGTPVDIEALENDFVAVAASYSQRQGISYAAWRQVGVEPSVLSRAGISRGAA